MLPAPAVRTHTFDGLADDVVEYALTRARSVQASRGDVITRQGEPATHVFVLRQGYAKLVSTSPDAHEVLVGIVGPRDIFGHAAMTQTPRTYMVTSCALTPLVAASWDRDTARAIAREFPDVHQKLDAQMILNLECVLRRLHTVSEGRVPQRLARALLELSERHGIPDGDGVTIAPPLTRQDIATIAGTTIFTASRLLSEWQHQGLVRSARARVSIRSVEGLRLIASDMRG